MNFNIHGMNKSLAELPGMIKNAEQNIKKANAVLLVQKGKGKGEVGKGKPKPKSKARLDVSPKEVSPRHLSPSHKRRVCVSIVTMRVIGKRIAHYVISIWQSKKGMNWIFAKYKTF